MEELRTIEHNIKKEYSNLKKNKHRSRTLENILLKKQQLEENFSQYKKILKTFQFRLSPSEWNIEVESYGAIKIFFSECIRILDNTIVNVIENTTANQNYKPSLTISLNPLLTLTCRDQTVTLS